MNLQYNNNGVIFKVANVTLGGDLIGHDSRDLLERKYR